MLYEHVEFFEAAFVKKHCNPFPCGKLAFLVLCVYPFLTASHARRGPALYQFLDFILLNAHILYMYKVLLQVLIPTKIAFFPSLTIKKPMALSAIGHKYADIGFYGCIVVYTF
jgi:hypothetical protein